MKHIDGYLPLDWDAKAGKLYLEIPHLDAAGNSPDILYTHSLPYGTGSNDLGLDRGQISAASSSTSSAPAPRSCSSSPTSASAPVRNDPAEQLAVRQSFPESVLYGFKVEAEDPNGTVLVDATDFFLRDAHDVAGALTRTQQGTYKLDPTRSTIALDATKAFPKNTEVEAILTFTTDGPARGEFVRDVTPDPHALTVREHQSFVELPGPGFTPRRFDPRAGYFPTTYRDYNVPVSESARPAVHHPPPPHQKRPHLQNKLRSRRPHPVLRRQRRRRAHPHRPPRRRTLVGPGLPGRRLGQRHLQG